MVGFDGALRISADGRSWKDGELTSQPRSLAVSPDGRRVLATTADGLMSSTDGGKRWSTVKGAPLLLLVDWAEGESVRGWALTEGFTSAITEETVGSSSVTAANAQAMTADGKAGVLRVHLATDSDLVTVDVSGYIRHRSDPCRVSPDA